MGRPWRASAGGYVYHVLNRANARLPLFQKEGDHDQRKEKKCQKREKEREKGKENKRCQE
jgi:hypothetical protein